MEAMSVADKGIDDLDLNQLLDMGASAADVQAAIDARCKLGQDTGASSTSITDFTWDVEMCSSSELGLESRRKAQGLCASEPVPEDLDATLFAETFEPVEPRSDDPYSGFEPLSDFKIPPKLLAAEPEKLEPQLPAEEPEPIPGDQLEPLEPLPEPVPDTDEPLKPLEPLEPLEDQDDLELGSLLAAFMGEPAVEPDCPQSVVEQAEAPDKPTPEQAEPPTPAAVEQSEQAEPPTPAAVEQSEQSEPPTPAASQPGKPDMTPQKTSASEPTPSTIGSPAPSSECQAIIQVVTDESQSLKNYPNYPRSEQSLQRKADFEAMRRVIETAPPEVFARWVRAKSFREKRSFLQDWLEDPSWGKLLISERRLVTETEKREKNYEWMLKSQMIKRFVDKEYVDKLCAKKLGIASEHSANREIEDPEKKFVLYKVWKFEGGTSAQSSKETGLELTQEMANVDAATAKSIVGSMAEQFNLKGDGLDMLGEGEGEGAGGGEAPPTKKRRTKEKGDGTHVQHRPGSSKKNPKTLAAEFMQGTDNEAKNDPATVSKHVNTWVTQLNSMIDSANGVMAKAPSGKMKTMVCPALEEDIEKLKDHIENLRASLRNKEAAKTIKGIMRDANDDIQACQENIRIGQTLTRPSKREGGASATRSGKSRKTE